MAKIITTILITIVYTSMFWLGFTQVNHFGLRWGIGIAFLLWSFMSIAGIFALACWLVKHWND